MIILAKSEIKLKKHCKKKPAWKQIRDFFQVMEQKSSKHTVACTQLWFSILIAFSLLFISRPTVDYTSPFIGERREKLAVLFTTLFNSHSDEEPITTATTTAAANNTCTGRYIYVHELPDRFNNEIIQNCRYNSLLKWRNMCPSLSNFGLGTQVQDPGKVLMGKSWYVTDQFTLEVIFHQRIKQYDCLTNDSSLASAIFVPYYAGFDVGRHLWGDYNTTVRDALGIELVKWLRNQPEWNKGPKGLFGKDHFFVSGRIAWDLHRSSNDDDTHWGSNLMQLPESKNMTMLSIETTSSNNEFAIPYPTYFHPRGAKQVHQWQKRIRRQKRPYLFSFVGAPRANTADSIRGELMKQCRDLGKKSCKLLNCQSTKCESPVEVMKVLQRSIFCLQPSGDSYTRRSIFDSILAGCIPVFFHPFSAYGQYTWHFPRNYSSYSVYIPEKRVKQGKVSVRKRLLGISKQEVAAMRQVVVELIPKVIYRNPASKSKDFEDAFDIAVNRVLERVAEIRRRDSEEGEEDAGSWKLKMDGIGKDHEWDEFF